MNSPVLTAALPVLENIAAEIEKSIEFYLSSLRYSDAVDSVVSAAAAPICRGLLPFMARRLAGAWKPATLG